MSVDSHHHTPNADGPPVRVVVDRYRDNLKAVREPFDDAEHYPRVAEPGRYDLTPGGVMILACPGCGHVSGMRVGDPKPDNGNGATWRMTGPPGAPTLSPSVNCVGCCGWHGWLTAGVFTLKNPGS